ncbi:unnamed protein product [Closterium sp. Naga37s-1]|nr:unnamed protein product [Closterium sp. Naga37s-1]
MMLISQGGFCVAYLIFIGQNVSSVLSHSTRHKTLVIAAVAPLEVLLSWMRSLTRLAPFSIFADVANVSAFALVICYGIYSFHGFSHLSAFTGLSNAPMALGVAVYAFEGVGMTLPLQASMKQPSRFPSVLALGLGIISVTYAAVGLAGYVGYGEETQEIITLNLPPGWPSEAVKLGICAALFFTFPVMMHPVHEIYERRLYLSPWVQWHVLSNNTLRRTLFRSLRSLAVLAVALVAVGVPHFSAFISLIGCSVCSALAFVFPALFHLKACKGRTSGVVVAGNWFLVVFGVAFGLWGTLDAVKRFQLGPGHLTHLELSSRFARNTSRRRYEDRTALPPLHAFPSLRAVTLGFHPKEISPLLRCSALTSLSLWQPTGGDLACLASPCFSPSFRSSLQSLTIQSGNLTNYLPRVSSFTSLSSLSLESCTFNPCELHSLSRSLHSLTHLTIDNCPSVCGRAVAAMVRANPSLSSLSLSGSSYRLFSSKPLSAVLRLSSRKLQTLTLAGLPSFRPGMLAGCSSLESLTLERTEGSLEGLLGMLVRADEAGGLMARRVDTPAGAGAGAGGGAGTGAGASADADAPAAAPSAAAAEGRIEGNRRAYIDIRAAAASARADAASAWRDMSRLIDVAGELIGSAHAEADTARRHQWLHAEKPAIKKIMGAISACQSASAGAWDANAARVRARAVVRHSAAAAAAGAGAGAGASGVFTTEFYGNEEERWSEDADLEAWGLGSVVFADFTDGEYRAGATPDGPHHLMLERDPSDGIPEVSREELFATLDGLYQQLRPHQSAMRESVEALLAGEDVEGGIVGAVAAAGGAAEAAGGAAEPVGEAAGDTPGVEQQVEAAQEQGVQERVDVEGVQEEGAQREEFLGEGEEERAGSSRLAAAKMHEESLRVARVEVICPSLASLVLENIQFSPPSGPTSENLPSTFPLLLPVSRTPPCSTFRPSTSLSSPDFAPSASPAQQQQSFESIALAAVFGGLRRLAVVACGGVGEEQLRAVLRACRVLVELRVERSDAMSDALLRACPIDTLTHATLIACNGITSAGVIGLLESFPRLRQLKVEADKVPERARRKLLRAGVIIRGV